MPTNFSQSYHDPHSDPKPRARFPIAALAWIPLSLLIGAGIVYAAKYGHGRARMELDTRLNPGAGNETLSEPFAFDPGDDPIVLAADGKALRDHLSAPPGSTGSATLIVSTPLRLRIVERDEELARVIVIDGELAGQRFWTRADRILKAKLAR